MGDIDEIEMPDMSVGYRNSSEQAAAQDLARGGRTVDDFAKWVLQGRVCMCSHSGQQKLRDPANEWVLAFFNGHMPEYDRRCNKEFEKDTHLRDHVQEKAHEWGHEVQFRAIQSYESRNQGILERVVAFSMTCSKDFSCISFSFSASVSTRVM